MPRFPSRLVASAALAVSTASPALAFDLGLGLFKRKPAGPAPAPQLTKAEPALRLKQLLATLQSDPDIDRRTAAAEQLKGVDPRGGTDVFDVLAGAIQKDPSPAVRTAAAEALGVIKAGTSAAGAALEAVERNDPDAGVRAAAKAALWEYQLRGYKLTLGPKAPAVGQSSEPAFAKPRQPDPRPVDPRPSVSVSAKPADTTFRPITQGEGTSGGFRESPEPAFAKPRPVGSKPADRPTIPPPALPPLKKDPPMKKDPPTVPAPPSLPTAPPVLGVGGLPLLDIPAPPVIVAPPPGSGAMPTIVPPGGK